MTQYLYRSRTQTNLTSNHYTRTDLESIIVPVRERGLDEIIPERGRAGLPASAVPVVLQDIEVVVSDGEDGADARLGVPERLDGGLGVGRRAVSEREESWFDFAAGQKGREAEAGERVGRWWR